MVTSLDEDHPGRCCVDGCPSTFWLSTGLFPQEILVSLGTPGRISGVRLACSHIRSVRLEGSSEDSAAHCVTLAEAELANDCALGHEPHQIWESGVGDWGKTIRCVKLVVSRGWGDFCCVRSLQVMGTPATLEDADQPPQIARSLSRKSTSTLRRSNTGAGLLDQPLQVEIPDNANKLHEQKHEPHAPKRQENVSAW